MPDLICKARYFRMGEKAPKNSCFKGKVSPASIFGGSNSYFNYTERYNDSDKEKASLIDYTGRYEHTMTSDGFLDTEEKKKAFKDKGLESLSKEGSVVYEIICSMENYEKASNYSLTNQDQFSAVITKITAELCQDASQNTASAAIELIGTVCALSVAMPLIVSMIKSVGGLI